MTNTEIQAQHDLKHPGLICRNCPTTTVNLLALSMRGRARRNFIKRFWTL